MLILNTYIYAYYLAARHERGLWCMSPCCHSTGSTVSNNDYLHKETLLKYNLHSHFHCLLVVTPTFNVL